MVERHFQRAFSMMAGISPAEYLSNRRLSQAGAELANQKVPCFNMVLGVKHLMSMEFLKDLRLYIFRNIPGRYSD